MHVAMSAIMLTNKNILGESDIGDIKGVDLLTD